jgi:hypothetical protein
METTSHRGTLTPLDWLSIVLVTIGALNWGFIGLAQFNLVAEIFGPDSIVSRIVYVLVALAGVYLIVMATSKFNGPRFGRRTDVRVGRVS